MQRWQQDRHIAYREWQKHRKMHVRGNTRVRFDEIPLSVDQLAEDYAYAEQVGRFRKQDAHDCGKPHCRICHSGKFPKREKHNHEVKSDLGFKEQLQDR